MKNDPRVARKQPQPRDATPPPLTPCDRYQAALERLDALMSGDAVRIIETPALGRVEFEGVKVTDLQRMVDQLRNECAAYLGMPCGRRGPISVEVDP